MKLWCWEEGRQGSGYRKLTLAFSKRFNFDCYLIEIGEGVEVPTHRDPSPEGYEHHRYNFTLRFPEKGGETYIDITRSIEGSESTSPVLRQFPIVGRSYLFRPDLWWHGVTKVEKGKLLLFSFGWLKRST